MAPDDNNFPIPGRPLALNADEPTVDDEDHVETPALGNRAINLDSKLDRFECNGCLSNRSLLIRCHTSQRTDSIGWAMSGCATGRRATLRGERQGLEDPLTSLEQARRIAGLAEEKLAQDIVILDMRPVCAYTDFFVVCSGQNPRQTKAIFDEVRHGLKHGERVLPHSVDGESQGDWIVADYLDVVLHVFTPETREYYRLEELWDDVPSIEHVAS